MTFKITCDKCGSMDVSVSSDSHGECDICGNYTWALLHCNSCKNEEKK